MFNDVVLPHDKLRDLRANGFECGAEVVGGGFGPVLLMAE